MTKANFLFVRAYSTKAHAQILDTDQIMIPHALNGVARTGLSTAVSNIKLLKFSTQ